MPNTPNHPTGQTSEQEEQTRRQFEADAISSQSNVLPLDAARNEGRFYGNLIRGERSLNGVQRIGFFLVGFLFCGSALFIVTGAFPELVRFMGLQVVPLGDKSTSMAYLPFAAISFLVGLKIIVSAIAPRQRKLESR
jgi:hypothetical protein